MSLVSTQTQQQQHSFPTTLSVIRPDQETTTVAAAAVHDNESESNSNLGTLLGAFAHGQSHNSMDRGAPEGYTQSGLSSPYPAFSDAHSEGTSADHASAAQYTPQQEVRTNNYSTSATPTSEYGVYPPSARSTGSFPEHIQRQYHPASNHSGSSGGMAQATSPSTLPDGRSNHHNPQIKSDQDVPIDPSIAASSPTYPQHGAQYSPYPPQQDMSQHGYAQHPGAGQMYAQPRPDWGGYGGQPHHMPPYPSTGVSTPSSAAPVRTGQVSGNFLLTT